MSDNETSEDVNLKPLNVFVCGGGNVVNKFYYKEAYELGKGLAKIGTAYGQGGLIDRHTIMGESYWGYKENNGKETHFFIREAFKDDLTPKKEKGESIEVVQDIAGLVREQFIWADVIVVMPGGTGTIEELFGHSELQLDYEKHPKIIIYNPQLLGKQTHFFDGTLSQIQTSIEQGFIGNDSYIRNIIVKYSIQDILADIEKEKNGISECFDVTERKG